MISLSRLDRKTYQYFNFLTEGNQLEVIYDDKVWLVSAQQLDKKPVRKYMIRKPRTQMQVIESRCPECGDMRLNDVCLNKSCINGQVTKESAYVAQ